MYLEIDKNQINKKALNKIFSACFSFCLLPTYLLPNQPLSQPVYHPSSHSYWVWLRLLTICPFTGDNISFCIFIASRTTTDSPLRTSPPSRTRTSINLAWHGSLMYSFSAFPFCFFSTFIRCMEKGVSTVNS